MAKAADPPAGALAWLTLQIGTLYETDREGRLLRANEPAESADGAGGDAAPFLFFGRTKLGNLWRLRTGLPDALLRELARLAAAERVAPDLEAVPERLHAMRTRIEAHAPVVHAFAGLAFRFPAPDGAATRARVADVAASAVRELDAAGLARAAEVFPRLAPSLSERQPVFGVLPDGVPRSIAYCATRPGRACEVGVDTAPGWRGKGFAASAVSAWAAEMQGRGVIPLYSAALENAASRAVAARLGLIPYASDWHFR